MRTLGKVEWDRDARGDVTWRVRSSNSNIMADSSEGYRRPIDAKRSKLSATMVLLADLTDEEFYKAVAYRHAVQSGQEPPLISPEHDEEPTDE